MREFPASVTRRIRHKATIPPILKALELNKLEHFPISLDAFAVEFMLSFPNYTLLIAHMQFSRLK